MIVRWLVGEAAKGIYCTIGTSTDSTSCMMNRQNSPSQSMSKFSASSFKYIHDNYVYVL